MAVDRLIYEFSERGIAGLRNRVAALRQQLSGLLRLQARLAKAPISGADPKLARAARSEVRGRQVEMRKLQDAIKKIEAPTMRATRATRGFTKSLRGMNKAFRISRGLMLLHAGLMAGRLAQSLISGTVGFVKLAGNIQVARQQFEITSRTMGTMADQFLPQLREATLGTISDLDLMSISNFALNSGLDVTSKQFTTLTQNAFKLSKVVGRDATESLQRLTFGIVKQERRILDELGVIVRANEVFKKFAKAHSIVNRELTAQEKLQAFLAAVIEETTKKVAKFNTVNFESATIGERVAARFENVKNRIAEIFVESGAAATALSLISGVLDDIEAFFDDPDKVESFFAVVTGALKAVFSIVRALLSVIAALSPAIEAAAGLVSVIADILGPVVTVVTAPVRLIGSLFDGGGGADTASAVQAGLGPSMAQARGERSELARQLRNQNMMPDIVSPSVTVSPT